MAKRNEGLLIVVSGPSGVGKGTILRSLINRNSDMKFSVSVTTRECRDGEIEGVNYFFKTRAEFEKMIANDEFLEYMEVFGADYYGTPRQYVLEELQNGNDIVLEIDVNGAMKIKETYADAVFIFIVPPAMGELKSRLFGRGSDLEETIERRFTAAYEELKMVGDYDYVVVNDVVDKAVGKLECIIAAEKLKVNRSHNLMKKLLEEE